MEWQQLEYFHTVARIQHFTRAAEMLSISQPTLSRSISKLESDLGVPLFERKGRQVILNHYGHMFLKRVHRAIQEITEGQQEIRNSIDPEHGNISFAFLKSLGSSTVPSIASAFLAKYPKINFNFFQSSTSIMLKQLEAREIDFCLSYSMEEGREIEWVHLWTEEIFAFVPNGHRLANSESISLHEFSGENFIAIKQGYGLRAITDQLFDQVGIIPNITFESEEAVTIAGFVSANLGVTLLPKIKGVDMTNITCLRVDHPHCERSIGIAWNKERYLSPAAERFQQFIFEYFKCPIPI